MEGPGGWGFFGICSGSNQKVTAERPYMAQCSNVGPPLRRFGQIFKPELDNQQELKQEFFNFCLAVRKMVSCFFCFLSFWIILRQDVFSRDSFRLGCLKVSSFALTFQHVPFFFFQGLQTLFPLPPRPRRATRDCEAPCCGQ